MKLQWYNNKIKTEIHLLLIEPQSCELPLLWWEETKKKKTKKKKPKEEKRKKERLERKKRRIACCYWKHNGLIQHANTLWILFYLINTPWILELNNFVE